MNAVRPLRLAIVTSHPIQYNAPAFRALAAEPGLDVRVFYEWEGPGRTIDPGFGHAVTWDVPLLDGYAHVFIPNVAREPGSHHFRGIDNPALVEEIRAWSPDVLLVYGWAFVSHLRVLRAFHRRVPILFRGDSTLVDHRRPGVAVARRALLRWVYRHVDVALYAGTLNRAYYRACGVGERRLVWAPHAVDNARFSADAILREAEARAWRARLGIDDGDTVFLFAGKLMDAKEPATLLRAFVGVRRESTGRAVHLVFAGEGEQSASLRERAAGRTDVHFLGFQNQAAMPTVYRIGDVLVLPSRSETWGLAVNEAMACGRASIVSDRVGCGLDLIRSGTTGFVFEHGKPKSLESAMSKIIGDRGLPAKMGRNALAQTDKWSIPAYARAVTAAARSLVGRADTTRKALSD
ncbi:MAG: glycosyltransferase family 4 protein [Gemmatimonadaceae bacterium]|nr:glycosyltransferase family 4 protein [Gemmatimonadaceae bacterium]